MTGVAVGRAREWRRRKDRRWPGAGRRRGAVLATALVCMLLLLLFAGAVARTMAVRERAGRGDIVREQCFWLLESACSRAVARVAADPQYQGETWQVAWPENAAAAADARDLSGEAEIRVASEDGPPGMKRIQVTAAWPADPRVRVYQSREFVVSLEPIRN